MNGTWHKGSRYWRFGTALVLAVQSIGTGVIIWRSEFTGAALEMIGTVTAAFVVGAGVKSGVGEYNKPAFQTPPTAADQEQYD